MTRRRGAALLVALAVLLAWPASSAAQESQAKITGISVEGDSLSVGFSSGGGVIDQQSVTLSVDGEPVDATVSSVDASDVERSVVLLMDASNSMAGAPIENAKSAATSFVTSVPAEVPVGLVTFNNTAEVVQVPTLDRTVVVDAIEAIELQRQTALYEGVTVATETAGDQGFRSILLLSDGRNTVRTTTLEQATSALEQSGVTMDAVALGVADTRELQTLTEAGNGTVIPADQADQLGEIFAAQAESITNEVVVTADLPQPVPSGAVTIEVSAQADGEPVSASAVASLATAPTETTAPTEDAAAAPGGPPAFVSAGWFIPVAIVALFMGLLGLLLVAFGPLRGRKKDEVTKRLAVYTISQRGATEVERKESATSSAVATQALSMADSVVKSRGIEQSLDTTLSAAAVPMTPAEWLLAHTGAAIGGGLLLFLISSFNPWWALLGLGLGTLIPYLVLKRRTDQRQQKFTEQLPDTLTLMAGSLTAGYSLPQAVDTVVREGQQPIAEEMNKALIESRLGVPVEEALENIAIRTKNKDFAWVVMAISIQRQVGGNLSEILRIVAETLRERAYLRRQIRTLSAEGRISSIVIAAMPFVMLIYLLLVRPEYITLLFTDVWGWIMLGGALVLQFIGWFWMRRIVNFEV
jgi:tight adherence protein B